MRRPVRAVCATACALLFAGCGSGSAGGPTSSVPTSAPASVPSTPAPTISPSLPASVTRSATSATPQPSRSSARPTPSAPAGIRGKIVVLNPGHNGGNASHPAQINRLVPAGYGDRKACDTTGTNTFAGYPEHAFNWDVSLRIQRALEAAGVKVVLTRPNDSGVGPCVDERAAIGNKSDVAAVVSIHADGAPVSGHGFHVNQAGKRPDGATKAVADESVQLGKAIHKTLVRSSGLTPSNYIGSNGYYYRSDLAGLNTATRPATFLELGNMRNSADAALLTSKSGRARIASAIAAGILAYLR